MKQATLHYSKKKIFDAVKQVAVNLNIEVKKESSADGVFILFSSGGLFSFGNRIDVKVKILESSKSLLKVSSQSAASIQIVDWGTNTDLESSIINEVRNIIGQ